MDSPSLPCVIVSWVLRCLLSSALQGSLLEELFLPLRPCSALEPLALLGLCLSFGLFLTTALYLCHPLILAPPGGGNGKTIQKMYNCPKVTWHLRDRDSQDVPCLRFLVTSCVFPWHISASCPSPTLFLNHCASWVHVPRMAREAGGNLTPPGAGSHS